MLKDYKINASSSMPTQILGNDMKQWARISVRFVGHCRHNSQLAFQQTVGSCLPAFFCTGIVKSVSVVLNKTVDWQPAAVPLSTIEKKKESAFLFSGMLLWSDKKQSQEACHTSQGVPRDILKAIAGADKGKIATPRRQWEESMRRTAAISTALQVAFTKTRATCSPPCISTI